MAFWCQEAIAAASVLVFTVSVLVMTFVGPELPF